MAFNEYHNSLDDEKFISFKTIIESIKIYNDVLCSLDNNFTPIAKFNMELLSFQDIRKIYIQIQWNLIVLIPIIRIEDFYLRH